MKLTTSIKKYVVVTFQGNKHFITEAQEKALGASGNNKLVKIGGAMINTSTIAEIVDIETFYDNHPKERPTYDVYNDWTGKSNEEKINDDKRSLKEVYLDKLSKSKKRLEDAIKEWKRQELEPELYPVITGGRKKLIEWAEDKLLKPH